MAFLDELREYLRGVESGATTPRVASVSVDLPAARRHFIEAVEQREAAPDRVRADSGRWLVPRGSRDAFIRRIETYLCQGLCAGADAATLQRCAHHAIDLAVGLSVGGLSATRQHELQAVVDDASMAMWGRYDIDVHGYAIETRLVRAGPGQVVLSSPGRVLLGLPEPDAVRWLLLIETVQSLGRNDDMRMPREALAAVLDAPHKGFSVDQDEDGVCTENEEWPWSAPGMRRLVALGVVERELGEDLGQWAYNLVPAWREMLDEIVSKKPTPWRVLAETLIAEERNAVPAAHASAGSADDGTVVLQRHARMVAHEIHNAMTPVQHALGKLYDLLARHAPDQAWRQYQERVDRNIDRTMRFAVQMADAASLAVAPAEPFDPVAAVRDAIAELNGALAGRVAFEPAGEIPRVRGHRHRFVMVIVNLLRNAAQSAPERAVRVRVDLAASPEGLHLAVNDDGPGVPEAYREAVFQPNFTLRSDGRGQGFALVRDVVVRELGGSVHYEPSDLGGARFVLRLPAITRSET